MTESLASRLRQVADLYESRELAAKAAKVSYPQFYRYLNGITKIPLIVAMRLAEPYSISMDWIASGNGNMFAEPEHSATGELTILENQISDHINNCLADKNLSISGDKREELIRSIVKMSTASSGTPSDPDDLDRYTDVIRLVATG